MNPVYLGIFVSLNQLFLTNSNLNDMFALNNTNTWFPLDCAPEIRFLYDLQFTDAAHGWIVGERGAILTSGDMSELSVESIQDRSLLQISPNPSSTVISVHTDLPVKKIEIRDWNGRLVKETTNKQEISIMELNSGMYVVYAITESGVSTAKFCKL